MANRSAQLVLLKKHKDAYGGELRKSRKGREGPRPLVTKYSMHLVLRSSLATKEWSFKKPKNEQIIKRIVTQFAEKYGVKVYSLGNAGNHLHFHLKLTNRFTYKAFVRSITGAIAMAVTGSSRKNPLKKILSIAVEKNPLSNPLAYRVRKEGQFKISPRFWDYRPFTRVVQSLRAFLNLKDYIQINQLEGFGCDRSEARYIITDARIRPWKYRSG
jgi:REP element-mobilizing transposase RayT